MPGPHKRKRSATQVAATSEVAPPAPQPSSRDASEEDAADPVLQQLKHKKSDLSIHTARRTRSSKSEQVDDEEHKDKDDSDRPIKRSKSSDDESEHKANDDAIEYGMHGERGTMRMEAPPKAGLVDPVGYHTDPPPTGRPVRIYADGVFDLFHLGHMRQLQQAKQAFPEVHLLVGVTGDEETHQRKGLTVLSAKERAESVRHCKWVDEVIEDCPWIITDAPGFLEKHEIDYVAHDDIPYGADEGDDIYAPIKQQGKFLVTQRTEGVSTTGIITKIVRDYDKYITRQLKRGTTRQELNISWLKKNELDMKRTLSDLRDSLKANWSVTGHELGRDLRQFFQPSRPGSPARTPIERHDDPLRSPSALARLSHLEIPRANGSSDFATGYSLGLIGGVRSWMARSRRNLNDSRPESPDSGDESSSEQSPKEHTRGRLGKQEQDQVDAQVVDEMEVRS